MSWCYEFHLECLNHVNAGVEHHDQEDADFNHNYYFNDGANSFVDKEPF